MKTNIHILPAICILCLCACKSGNASSLNKNDVIQDTIKTFTLPAIPPMMTAPEQRADFLVKHYWDNVNFADTNYIHHPEVTEQAWADYCDILNHVPLETAQEAMRKTIEQTNVDKKVFTYITDLAECGMHRADARSVRRNGQLLYAKGARCGTAARGACQYRHGKNQGRAAPAGGLWADGGFLLPFYWQCRSARRPLRRVRRAGGGWLHGQYASKNV